MSREIALANIDLQPAQRWGHTEYSLLYHKDYLAKKVGVEYGQPGFSQKVYDRLDMDMIWHTDDGLTNWQNGRVTDMGHASYAADGGDQRASSSCPFKSEEEIWAFDAVEEYGLPDFDEQVKAYENVIQQGHKNTPNQLLTGGYYKSLVSGAIQSFGWEMLLIGFSEPEKMDKVMEGFFQRTLFHMKAWAKTSAEVLIQHDDFVWTAGAFIDPELYRKMFIPRYKKLWEAVHEAGKKVLFCSDGEFMQFAGDVVEAGADGLIFEPCNDFGVMAEKFGKTTCLVGSFVDCRDLDSGKWDKVKSDIEKTLECLKSCKGALFATGNHLPANIPPDMMDRYFDYLLPRLARA